MFREKPISAFIFSITNYLLPRSIAGEVSSPQKENLHGDENSKGIRFKLPELTYLEKSRKGIILKRTEVIRAFIGLTFLLLLVYFIVLKSLGFVKTGVVPNLLVVSPMLVSLIAFLTTYGKRSFHTTLFCVVWLLPGLMILISLNNPEINYSRLILIYLLVAILLSNATRKKIAEVFFLIFAFSFIQIRYSNHLAKTVAERYQAFEVIMLPVFLVTGFLILARIRKEFISYQKEIRNQKEVLEKKNESLESLVSFSEEQKDKLKRTVLFKEKLISIISHDIRVPINSFRFLIDNYEKGNLTDKMVLDGMVETKDDLVKMDSMVVDLVNWSMSEKTTTQPTHICPKLFNEIADSVISIYALSRKNKNLVIIKEIEIPDNMKLSISKRELEIVLRNLLSNAIKYSHPGNKIIISLKVCSMYTRAAALSVQDFGTGIHPSLLKKLNGSRMISTMGTLDEVGLGVGLSIVFDVINNNSLRYSIKSMVNEGTCFSLSIPMATT